MAKLPARKQRVQSKIAKLLSDPQREQLHEWMREGLIYSEIAHRVWNNFGVSIAESSLCTYYGKHAQEIHGQQAPGASETVHVNLVFHVLIRPEIVALPAANSDGK